MEQNTPPTQPPQKAPPPPTEPQAADATQAAHSPQKKEITLLTEPTRQILVILLPIAGLFLILWAEMADNRRATEAQITELRQTTENIRVELAQIKTILQVKGYYRGFNETATKTEPTPSANPTPLPQTPSDATDAPPSTGTS